MRLLSAVLLLGLVLFSFGCGGESSSYKDREVDPNAPENVESAPVPPPGQQ
jgi:hypothetical protein